MKRLFSEAAGLCLALPPRFAFLQRGAGCLPSAPDTDRLQQAPASLAKREMLDAFLRVSPQRLLPLLGYFSELGVLVIVKQHQKGSRSPL